MDFNNSLDFLSDDNFILWRLSPTEESDAYWNDFRKNNPALENELDSAIAKFSKVRINDHKLPKEYADGLFQRCTIHTVTQKTLTEQKLKSKTESGNDEENSRI